MALRTCASCGGNLLAGATARAKFCSATCRKRASRTKGDPPVLALVPAAEDSLADAQSAPTSQLDALEDAAKRLVRLLDESDPRSAAALNKEYRETLRELAALRTAAAAEAGVNERTSGHRRSFDASAI